LAKVAGDVLYFRGDIATVEADGDITKGDPLKITGASTKSGVYIKVGVAGGAVTDVVIGVAPEAILDGKLGPMIVGSLVVFLTGKATVTIGAWVGPSGTASQVMDVPNTEGAVVWRPCVGVAWKGVSADTGVIPVQLMPCVFATYVS